VKALLCCQLGFLQRKAALTAYDQGDAAVRRNIVFCKQGADGKRSVSLVTKENGIRASRQP